MNKGLDFSRILPEQEATDRYLSAAHAMQTGVAMKMHFSDESSPKHLRVGVNSALTDSSALAELLIHKGIITKDEYLTAICLGMEREVETYKTELKEMYPNTEIKLV